MPLYQPPAFASDTSRCQALAARFPFATLITPTPDGPWLSHLVLLADPAQPGSLLGHLAAANGHVLALQHYTSVAVFQGEHGYVSPRWYHSAGGVPTWNYRVAHAHCGVADTVAGDALTALLATLTQPFEGEGGWHPGLLPPQALTGMQRAIVGFRLPVLRWEGKDKLSQNRHPADRDGVIAALQTGSDADRQLAAAMQAAAASAQA